MSEPTHRTERLDVAIVGAGLWGGLLAARLSVDRPELKLRLYADAGAPKDSETWCFHGTDLPDSAERWVTPLLSQSWRGQSVVFPGLERRFDVSYHAIRSGEFRARVAERIGQARFQAGSPAVELGADYVRFADGSRVEAACVIDARGPDGAPEGRVGYQKFLGLELELENDHSLREPLLMDASIEQQGAYRFMYLLPWSENRLLVEDTRYSDDASIDEASWEKGILDYVGRRGWKVRSILRRERAALPIPLDRASLRRPVSSSGPVAIGARARHFHPVTGYSSPLALRAVEALAQVEEWSPAAARAALRPFERSLETMDGFFLFLNRMLFLAAHPSERWRVFRRFYENSETVVFSFYTGTMGWRERAAVFARGRPPVPVLRGMSCLFEQRSAR